ncbi:MAG: ATP-binding protein [Bacillota bacterium]
MTSRENEIMDGQTPFWLAALISTLLVAVVGYLRLIYFYADIVPLAYGLPLLVCLWHRYRSLLWGMATAFVVFSFIKILWVLPNNAAEAVHKWAAFGLMLLDAVVVSVVVHGWLNTRDRLLQMNASLGAANAELAASNEELASREEEISGQNEELQSQAEEMEQQTEELARQGEELQSLNTELARREGALQSLLELSRRLRTTEAESEVLKRICQVALQVMEPNARATTIVERQNDLLVVRAHEGFGPDGPQKKSWAYEHSLASVVMECGRTASLRDTELRPDLEIPQPQEGPALRSLLVSPLRVEGQIIGALEIYSQECREWTEQEFGIVEWLASQCSLVLESVRLQRELELRRYEAEETSIRKTRFLAAVSHDVRTPANAINLMAELINRAAADPRLLPELPKLAGDLQANAKSLIALVSDMLDLARFESGRLELQETEFAICDMVNAEVRQLLPLAQSQGLQLIADQPAEAIWLRADRMKLARVVGNLIGNAIKFTERGSVRVECLRLPDGHAEIRVIDTGVGVAPEHLDRIFDEFYQLRNPERDRSKGTGLGLAICKRLLEAMGCDITVASELGKGSTFTLVIPPRLVVAPPVNCTDASGEDGRASRSRCGMLAGLRILLVEDHDTTRRATAQILAAEGAIVMQADGGRVAIHMLAHECPQVLLLDLMLPDIDGSEVLRSLRQVRPRTLKCVLAVSGDVATARQEEVRQLGADGLIAKPVDMEQLVREICSVMERSQAAGAGECEVRGTNRMRV